MSVTESLADRTAPKAVGYGWAAAGVALATACFWLARPYLDKGQASLLYLPVVIACAVRFGFGPAVLGAVLSFLCWDFFFLPPFGTFVVADPKDWLSLAVFLLAAVTTAQLASQAREQTQQARAREAEIATLFQASESLSREVRAGDLLDALAQLLQTISHASGCQVFRCGERGGLQLVAGQTSNSVPPVGESVRRLAEAAAEHTQIVGFGPSRSLWAKAVGADTEGADVGVFVPLQAEGRTVGVLHVGPRRDGQPFTAMDERLVLTLANHAAVVIARDDLARQAAQAQALLEADTLKDALLSLVSHELRSPLAAIKTSVTGLLAPHAQWEEAGRTETLRAVDRETDRLTTVVDNLLDLSRLEAGAWTPHRDWCDLSDVIATVLDRLPESQAARVQVALADDLPLVQADFTQIALVLRNLLENAAKYAPEGSPIRLSATAIYNGQEESPTGVTMVVRDYGPGLTPGEAERLFERFYRGLAHRDSAIHGTGLGLALCRAVVRAHGGRIWAANAPAGEPPGAVFSVFLPVNEAATEAGMEEHHEAA